MLTSILISFLIYGLTVTQEEQATVVPQVDYCSSQQCEPGPQGNKECQHYGYCSPTEKVCCLGHYGQCKRIGSRAIRPQQNCKNDEECGMGVYCDKSLKICCTEGHSPESYCPDGLTYKSVEPFCKENQDCPSNTTCIEEACCPIHKTKDSEILPLYFPFTTHRKCSEYDAPPLRNVFCRRDTGTWAILGEFRINGTENVVTERYCTMNDDCSPSTVCVLVSDAVGLCYEDPMKSPPTIDLLDTYWLIFYCILPTAGLIYGCMILIHKKMHYNYYH